MQLYLTGALVSVHQFELKRKKTMKKKKGETKELGSVVMTVYDYAGDGDGGD